MKRKSSGGEEVVQESSAMTAGKEKAPMEETTEFHGLTLPRAVVPYHLSPYSHMEKGNSGARDYTIARPAMLWAAQGGMPRDMRALLLTMAFMLDLGDAEGAICEGLITQGMEGEVAEFLMEGFLGEGDEAWDNWEIMPLSSPLTSYYFKKDDAKYDDEREGNIRPPALELQLSVAIERSAAAEGKKARNYREVRSPAFHSPGQWHRYLEEVGLDIERQLSDVHGHMNFLCYGVRLVSEMVYWCSKNHGIPREWRRVLPMSPRGVIAPRKNIGQELFKLHELFTPAIILDGVEMGEAPWMLEYSSLVEEYNEEWAMAAMEWSKHQGESKVTQVMNEVLARSQG